MCAALLCCAWLQEFYSLCLEQLQEAHKELQQTLAMQQHCCSAAAASAPAAAAASNEPDLATKAHKAIARMQEQLFSRHTVMRLKCESLVDFVLPPRPADAAAGQAVALPAAPARITRGSGKQQQAHEQRRAVRSDPGAAVLAVGRALQQGVDEVQLLPGEQLGVHWHDDFRRLAEQLQQQHDQEEVACQAMQQLEASVAQMQQQLRARGQHCADAGNGADDDATAAAAAAAGAMQMEVEGEDEEGVAGEAVAPVAAAAAAAGAENAAVAAACSQQQDNAGGALQDCSSGTAGAAASADAGDLSAAAGSAGPVTSAAAAAVAAPAVSAAEEQYAADKMAALGQMHAALQSADACMNALRQQNAQLEEENARLRQQLAAVQQAAGHVPQFEG